MITLATGGPTNDLVVKNGQLVLATDQDQIAQAVREALGTFFGEWFLDTTIGVPWLQQILVSNPNLDTIQALLLNAVFNVPGVANINQFEFGFTPGNRNLSVTIAIVTTNGQTLNLEKTVGI